MELENVARKEKEEFSLRKELPLEVIQQWLKDADCDVRTAAITGFHFFCTKAEAESY